MVNLSGRSLEILLFITHCINLPLLERKARYALPFLLHSLTLMVIIRVTERIVYRLHYPSLDHSLSSFKSTLSFCLYFPPFSINIIQLTPFLSSQLSLPLSVSLCLPLSLFLARNFFFSLFLPPPPLPLLSYLFLQSNI